MSGAKKVPVAAKDTFSYTFCLKCFRSVWIRTYTRKAFSWGLYNKFVSLRSRLAISLFYPMAILSDVEALELFH